MHRSIRYSILTILSVLCLGVALSGAGLRLPAFSHAGLQDPPAAIGEDEGDDSIAVVPADRPAKREVTLQTDKPEYAPGEVVVVTGSGWEPGEAVTLELQEDPKSHDARKVRVIADASGEIFDNQFVQDAHDKGTVFHVIAIGAISGLTTQAAFGNPSADLDQWANLDNAWVNGNLGASKAKYFEGDSIPYRLRFTNLTLASHTVTIEWDTTKSDKHALDYLTTFNRSVPTLTSPCAGVTNPACGAVTNFAIPADPQVTGAGVTPIAGSNFKIWGATITSVSAYSYPNGAGFLGDKSSRISITFTAAQSNPVLAWGGHISTRVDWGSANSCVTIPGSPFHTRLVALDGSGGNQDRSLSSDATIFPGSIRIVKDVAGGTDSASFPFTTSGPDLSGFSLADNGVAAADTKIFSNIATFGSQNSRSVTESDPLPSFALTGLACTSDVTPSGASVNVASRTATFVLVEGENVSCTFTNTRQQASLRVIKHVVNDNGGTKAAGDFTLHVKSSGSDVTGSPAAGSESGTLYTLLPGTYVVSENSPPSGYSQTGFSGDCNSGGSVTVASGESKTCTITNDDQAGTLTVIKHVINDNGGTKTASNFAITVTGNSPSPANFNGVESPGTSVTIGAGSFSVDEGAHDGYTKSLSGCSGTIANGESKTCTITNDDQAGTLTVIKHVINDNGGTKTASGFAITVTGNSPSPANFNGVESPGTSVTIGAGSFSVDEGAHDGYTKSLSGCSGTIANGESKTCTITNDDQAGTLTVIKHVINDNGGTKTASDFAITVTGNSPSPANFNGVESPGTSVTIGAGSFSVDEGAHDGYTKSLSGCSGTIANGESKTCTITNDDEKATPGIATEMSWTLEDKAVLSGLRTGASCDAASSTVTFTLYGPFAADSFDPSDATNCSGTPAYTSTAISVAEAASAGVGHAVSDVGVYVWKVHYSGDSCNNAQDSACNSEITEVKETNSIPPSP
jgi:Prealbumin-like fold domain